MDEKIESEVRRYAGDGSVVRRAFVILHEPGMCPEKKGAFLTRTHLDEFVEEVIACRSQDTQITIAELTWNDDLWLVCGRESFEMSRPEIVEYWMDRD